MVERWTRERRLEHTRSLLLDAAEDVFAEKGFTPATLDDIAHAAGYTKGAIYKHFATKEDLFLAVSDRYWRRYFDNFAEVMSSAGQIGERELDEIARRWRQLSLDRGAEHAALGHEFTLYLTRNPEARDRVAEKRSEVVEALAMFIVEGIDRLGGTLLDRAVDLRAGARRDQRLGGAGESTRRRRPLPADRGDVHVGDQAALRPHSPRSKGTLSGISAPSGRTSSPSVLMKPDSLVGSGSTGLGHGISDPSPQRPFMK